MAIEQKKHKRKQGNTGLEYYPTKFMIYVSYL
jgi:hypothetical protein